MTPHALERTKCQKYTPSCTDVTNKALKSTGGRCDDYYFFSGHVTDPVKGGGHKIQEYRQCKYKFFRSGGTCHPNLAKTATCVPDSARQGRAGQIIALKRAVVTVRIARSR